MKHHFLVGFQQSSVAPDLAVMKECWPFKMSLVTELCSSMERGPSISLGFQKLQGKGRPYGIDIPSWHLVKRLVSGQLG